MKLSDIAMDMFNRGSNFVKSNVQMLNPGKIYSMITAREETFDTGINYDATDEEAAADDSPPQDNKDEIDDKDVPAENQSVIMRTVGYLLKSIGILVSIVLAMLVANHLIMHPPIIRIFGFLATIWVCLINPLAFIGILAYYIFFILSRYYYNTTVKEVSQKRALLPYIFALLPISNTVYRTTLLYILTYPFTYELPTDQISLINEHNYYIDSIKGTYESFDATVKKYSGLNSLFGEYDGGLGKMHSYHAVDASGNWVKDKEGAYVMINPFSEDGVAYMKQKSQEALDKVKTKQEKAASNAEAKELLRNPVMSPENEQKRIVADVERRIKEMQKAESAKTAKDEKDMSTKELAAKKAADKALKEAQDKAALNIQRGYSKEIRERSDAAIAEYTRYRSEGKSPSNAAELAKAGIPGAKTSEVAFKGVPLDARTTIEAEHKAKQEEKVVLKGQSVIPLELDKQLMIGNPMYQPTGAVAVPLPKSLK